MFFKGPYLRVLTPKTTDGNVPLILDGEPQYKETFAPLSARKQLEKRNARLEKTGFKHLAAQIEVVGDNEDTVRRIAGEKTSQQKVNPKPTRKR